MLRPKPTSFLYRSLLAVLISVLLLFPLCSLTAGAIPLYPYNASSDYKSSIYYQNLTSLTLSGNGAADLLAVAMSQLGYHEGNSDSDLEGGNASGSRNFVEYNRLYGKLDNNEGNGYSYGYAWCASFVNWCLRQANVSYGIAGGEVSCSRWIRDFLKPTGRFYDSSAYGGRYTPKAGDLIFFRTSGSNLLSTHVGIVRYSDGTYVHTVEGNTASGAVALDAYLLDSTYIIGYGVPPYETNGREVCDYGESGKLAGIYIVTANSLNVRKGASASTEKLDVLPKAAMIRVESFDGSFARITTKDGRTGYVSRYYIELVAALPDEYHTVRFLDDDGMTVLAELSVRAGELPTAPTVPDVIRDEIRYTFDSWSEELLPISGDVDFVAVYRVAEAPEEGGADSPVTEEQDSGHGGDEEAPADGCGSVVGASLTLLTLTLAAPVAVVLRKKENEA